MLNLLKRSLSGLVYVLLFVGAILYAKLSFIGLLTIFGIICIWEFTKIIELKNIIPYLLFLVAIYLTLEYRTSNAVLGLLIINVISSSQLVYMLYGHKEITFNNGFSKAILLLRYVIISFIFLILLPFIDGQFTPSILIGVLVLIWTNDSFAFLIGKNIGKKKLFPSVSPKKTKEGFLGGLIFAVIVSYLVALQTEIFTILNWIIIGIMVSVFGTIGDLIESKFKRQANVKDSGNIMPGHGGLMDRLDSLLFVAPFVYLYINYLI